MFTINDKSTDDGRQQAEEDWLSLPVMEMIATAEFASGTAYGDGYRCRVDELLTTALTACRCISGR